MLTFQSVRVDTKYTNYDRREILSLDIYFEIDVLIIWWRYKYFVG